MAVGAAFWFDTTVCGDPNGTELESFSAKGGDPILFDSAGTLLGTPEMRQKPDIVGPDGGSNTFLGFKVGAGGTGQCSDSGNFPNFFGTSAATPHVAAVAALMLQKNPALTPAQIYSTLRSTTSPMTGTSSAPDNLSGYGFIKADAALADSGAVTVNLGLNPTTINVGQSATLTWSATNTDSCTASGSWPTNGNIAISGNLMVTPASAGSYTYTITCTNADSNALESQTLTVVTPSSGGGGGGGALDLAALLALSGAALARVRRTRRTAH
jgi:subtilisin family serine protease